MVVRRLKRLAEESGIFERYRPSQRPEKSVLFIGAGGHCRSVLGTCPPEALSRILLVDDDPDKWGATVVGITVMRGGLENALTGSVTGLPVPPGTEFLVTVGDNGARKRLYERARVGGLIPKQLGDKSSVGPGTIAMVDALVGPHSTLGKNSIINTGAIVEHDCRIGDHCHIGSGAILCGGVTVEEGVLVGAGAVVLPGVHIGAWSIIGAGAVVVKDVPGHKQVYGVPGRVTKNLACLEERAGG